MNQFAFITVEIARMIEPCVWQPRMLFYVKTKLVFFLSTCHNQDLHSSEILTLVPEVLGLKDDWLCAR